MLQSKYIFGHISLKYSCSSNGVLPFLTVCITRYVLHSSLSGTSWILSLCKQKCSQRQAYAASCL